MFANDEYDEGGGEELFDFVKFITDDERGGFLTLPLTVKVILASFLGPILQTFCHYRGHIKLKLVINA